MAKTSAGILLYKTQPELRVFLVHPGGPFWKNKDQGAWSIPKGLIEDQDKDTLSAACREFEEEIGFRPEGDFIELGTIRQKGGKIVLAWALAFDLEDSFEPQSNTFEMEWPPNSGNRQTFPEVDQARFFDLAQAKQKINEAQIPFLERLQEKLK